MSGSLRLLFAQLNPTVGDISGNVQLIASTLETARALEVDLILFPELVISGYPPEDLLGRPAFIRKCAAAIDELAPLSEGVTALVGAPLQTTTGLVNAAVTLQNGSAGPIYAKRKLPNYGVFDEERYFAPGTDNGLLTVGRLTIGVSVCEDMWPKDSVIQCQKQADLLVNLSASPYQADILKNRKERATHWAKKQAIPFAYCNLVGGQDELVFDGGSFLLDSAGVCVAEAKRFADDLLVADLAVKHGEEKPAKKPPIPEVERIVIESGDEEIYKAITLAVHDYVTKTGFSGVVIAESGGIDSALTTAIAVDALGSEKVHILSMPSPWSSRGSIDDAQKLADNFGLKLRSAPIATIMKSFDETLAEQFAGTEPDLAEENIQARIRGALVMALSNKFGWLVLTTGNKSEMAVGYCTLYGDMAGGFAVIKDLLKTKVYDLCRWRNSVAGYAIIPNNVIAKAPSAELRPDQKDSDSLPEYDILDPILTAYIEEFLSIDEIVKRGYDREVVVAVVRMVDRSEHKRRQAPIGPKVTVKSFGKDRRHPVTCQYLDE